MIYIWDGFFFFILEKRQELRARDGVTWAALSSDVRSADLSTEEEDQILRSADLHFGSFRVFCPGSLQLFADLLLRHGESVSGDPAAAAGGEESGGEGGRSPQTWVEEAAWEPAAAAPASRSKRMKLNTDVF